MSSALGKIFEIDFYTKKSNIISIGHDNPQGIFLTQIVIQYFQLNMVQKEEMSLI
jgi:hypothetical protein